MTEVLTAVHELMLMRTYVNSGATRSYAFRKQQLLLLRDAILENEKEIYAALYQDLKKPAEETYAAEIGMVLMEIRIALKNLRKWSRPESVPTNLLNLPSSSKIIHDPLGVVFIIAPWNYPFQLLILPLVGAIAGGNAVMLKPSELAPATAALLEKMIRRIFPSRYVSIVCGDGALLIPPMIRDFRFDHIFYTGSTEVGKIIYQLAAKQLIPVTLELGGKNPAVIERDADLEIAAKKIAIGKFLNAGQTCVAPDYLLVHSSVRGNFLKKLHEAIIRFYGDDAETGGSYGRIVNEERFDRLVEYLGEGKIAFGGRHDREKLFIAPTILEDIPAGAAMMRQEIFGPLLPVFTYDTMEEALAMIAMNPSPLAFYLFTQNVQTEKQWMESLSFGGGCVNNTLWHLSNHHLPFGGIGNSGMGAYHGKHSFYRFTHAKPVMKTPRWFDPAVKYPPFTGKMKWIKKLIR
jgi:aldehyde dehydrogenase (NAD+)